MYTMFTPTHGFSLSLCPTWIWKKFGKNLETTDHIFDLRYDDVYENIKKENTLLKKDDCGQDKITSSGRAENCTWQIMLPNYVRFISVLDQKCSLALSAEK